MGVLYGVAAATVSRTGRVSTVRWNLKESVGKVSVRLTGTAYEAALRLGEFAGQNKAQLLRKSECVDAADIWDEGIHSYPWRPHSTPNSKPRHKTWLRSEESAEGIVPAMLEEDEELQAIGFEGFSLVEVAMLLSSLRAGKARTSGKRRDL